MTIRHIFLLTFFLFLYLLMHAQDKVLLLNGKEFNTRIIDTNFLNITIQDNPGSKPLTIDRYRIFSIHWEGKELVLYKQDTIIGNFYSEHQMRMFVYGEKDAMQYFKTPYSFWGGLTAGLVGGFVQPLVISKVLPGSLAAHPVFTPIIPIGYCFVVGTRWIKIKKTQVSDINYLNEETYLEGFDREARGKRVQRAVWGALTGLLAGFSLSFVTSGL